MVMMKEEKIRTVARVILVTGQVVADMLLWLLFVTTF
jgi:hypothetical protein